MPKMTPGEVDELLASLRARMIEAEKVDVECRAGFVERADTEMGFITNEPTGGLSYHIRLNGGA
jgi:hypothetical protein